LEQVLEAQDVALLRYDVRDPTGALDADAQKRVLDALVARRFLTPPQLSQREHAARLLEGVFADRLGVALAEGTRVPPFRRIVERALQPEPPALIVLSTLDGRPLPVSERRRGVHKTLERQGPIDEARAAPETEPED
jgi:hypothetical protein